MTYLAENKKSTPGLLLLLCSLLFFSTGPWMFASTGEDASVSIAKFAQADKYFKAAREAFSKRNYQKSEKAVKKCLDIYESHANGHFLMSQIMYRKGELQGALAHIETAKRDFILLMEWFNRNRKAGESQQKAERMMLKSALQSLESSFEQYDCTRGISRAIAAAQQEVNDLDSRSISSAGKIAGVPAEYEYVHGNVLFKMKKYEAALERYRAAVEINPRHTRATNNLINILFLSRRYAQAEDVMNRAARNGVAVNPDLKRAVSNELKGPARAESDAAGWHFPGEKVHVHLFVVDVSGGTDPVYENTYVVYHGETGDAVIIDPGAADPSIEKYIEAKGLKVRKILNTHGHGDHIGANRYYADRFGVRIVAHEADRVLYGGDREKNRPDEFVSREPTLEAGALAFSTLHTPGHSVGSVCFLIDDHLFSGDTLFQGGIGNVWARTEAEREEKIAREISSIKTQLLVLPGNIHVYPGHGPVTTIEAEKSDNSFLK